MTIFYRNGQSVRVASDEVRNPKTERALSRGSDMEYFLSTVLMALIAVAVAVFVTRMASKI